MIEMRGKYNFANVMIDEIDEATRGQIQDFLNNPSFASSYIAIMPDCHKGNGSCIGFTMAMNQRIIPDIVGVDLGCGMLSYKFPLKEIDPAKLDEFIKGNIPSGFSIRDNVSGDYSEAIFKDTIRRIGADEGKVGKALGTLGGGNHFIEAGLDSNHDVWITIHSGSRNFGLRIAEYHGRVAKDLCAKWGAEIRGIPFLLSDSPEGQAYFNDAIVASTFARMSRKVMMDNICRFVKVDPIERIESIHNFIDETGMIRKGATPAHKGQGVIIPFNMRDGLAICVGKGSKKWNESAPHGAGRILSRSKAKETLDVDFFVEDMKKAGVYTTTANKHTIDEAPGAYKDKDTILKCIEETVDVVDFVKPIYNFKAGGE